MEYTLTFACYFFSYLFIASTVRVYKQNEKIPILIFCTTVSAIIVCCSIYMTVKTLKKLKCCFCRKKASVVPEPEENNNINI